MKKRLNLLAIITLMMTIISTACTPDGNQEFPDNGPVASYEVKSDTQLHMSLFLLGIPEEYAAFKEPLASMVTMRESALKQQLGKPDIALGFRKTTYLYPSTDVKGNPITLSALAFWLGYFDGGVWNDLKPDNICLMEHYTITSDAEAPSNSFALELFITGNTLTIMPDYIGYGITKRDAIAKLLDHSGVSRVLERLLRSTKTWGVGNSTREHTHHGREWLARDQVDDICCHNTQKDDECRKADKLQTTTLE